MNSPSSPDPAHEPSNAPDHGGSGPGTALTDWPTRRDRKDDARGIDSTWLCRLLEYGPQPFAAIDLERRIIWSNLAFSDLVGFARDELLGMSILDLTAPQSLEVTRRYQDDILKTGKIERVVKNYRRKDGSLVPVELVIDVLRDDSGQPMGLYAFITDISERARAEEAVVESERRARALFEGSLDAIVVADGEGHITLFNPAAEKIFGYASREVLDQPLARIMPGIYAFPPPMTADGPDPDSRGSAPAAAPKAEAEGDVADIPSPPGDEGRPRGLSCLVGRTVELTGRKKDGTEFPLELSLNSVEMNGRPQFIGSIRDQTERQRMHAMLAQSDKLASIGLLSAGVAHEINNPLAYVTNNLVVLERDVKGMIAMIERFESSRDLLEAADPKIVRRIDDLIEEIDWPYIRDNIGRILERTREGVRRVAAIIDKMRGLARTSIPQWESVALSDLVEGALEIMRGRLKHQGVEVAVSLHDVSRIRCVPDQIGQVLLNLLINALQAIEETGRSDGRIEVEARREGPWLAISVSDNGPGIDPQHRGRLFDPFFTTKPVGEGTGLGLAISHGIITGHGGRIEVESRLGEGTRFRLLLPQAPSTGPPPPPQADSRVSPLPNRMTTRAGHVKIVDCVATDRSARRGSPKIMPRRKHCLLIVDDEPNVCDSVHDLLRREFRVLKAHSAEEGYRLMQQEEVHIVMSDQRMPQISGVEMLTKVKTRYPQAIRMLFTGFADLESVITAINQGHVFQFVRKPWQPEELPHGGPAGGR